MREFEVHSTSRKQRAFQAKLSCFPSIIMELSFLVIFSSFLFISFLVKIWKQSLAGHSKLPPGPRKLPVIGNIHQLVGPPPHRRLRDLARKYGGVMHLQLGEVSNIVISSPAAAKEVMKTHDTVFAQRPALLAASFLTYDYTDIAFSPYGDYWRQLRKICMLELLSAKRVQSFRSIREEEVSNFIRKISASAGQAFNFSRPLFSMTYGIAARAAFGEKCKDQETYIPIVEQITTEAGGFSVIELFPSVKFLPMISGKMSRLRYLAKEADRILQNILDEHRTRRKETEKTNDREDEDLVDILLRFQDEENNGFSLTTDNIKAVIQDIFVAGSETSSTTVEWAMSEMLRSPRVMDKAQAEVRKVYGEKGNVDETALDELQYLKLVIKETLRLHPPAPLLLPRECRERCEIEGYEIPAKSKVIVNAWALGRDPNYWTQPDAFLPERFLESSVDYKGVNFEYIPFGAGRRICPGITFGLANVELPLAQLLYHFDWKLLPGVTPATLDMTEHFGATVRRQNDLPLIPVQYRRSIC